jgi:hypothetical protein
MGPPLEPAVPRTPPAAPPAPIPAASAEAAAAAAAESAPPPPEPAGDWPPEDAALDSGPPDALFDAEPDLFPTGTPPAGAAAPTLAGDLQPLLERIERILPGRVLAFVPASVDADEDPHVALAAEPLAADDEPDLGGRP